jgi:hypothetical protein
MADPNTKQIIAEWLCQYEMNAPFTDASARDQQWYLDQADDLIRHIYT